MRYLNKTHFYNYLKKINKFLKYFIQQKFDTELLKRIFVYLSTNQ